MEEKRGKINQRRKKKVAFVLFPAIIIIGAMILYFYLQYKKNHITTDDAFVDGRVHLIASKVPGTVKVIHIHDNQFVKKNDLILEIDPIDYDVKIREAQADLQAERAKLSVIRDGVETVKKRLSEIIASSEAARANFELQEANLRQAEIDFKRTESLLQKQVIPREGFTYESSVQGDLRGC
jgi:membrane fusion protein (multidrug efflux system)